jgi:hypothetical protein
LHNGIVGVDKESDQEEERDYPSTNAWVHLAAFVVQFGIMLSKGYSLQAL